MISRRKWFELTALNALASIGSSRRATAQSTVAALRENRIRRMIHAFEEQGFHRTGTSVDRVSGNWLREEARAAGLAGSLESFSIQRVDPMAAVLGVGDRRIDGIPLFDAAFTNEQEAAPGSSTRSRRWSPAPRHPPA